MIDPIKNCKWVAYPLGDITQNFGENPELYMKTMGLAYHNGIDIVRKYGEPLYAVEAGTVCAVREDAGGHGKHIRLVSDATNEEGFNRDWVYGHMSFIVVKNGQKVKAGDLVGHMGNTGFVVSNATGNNFWEYNPYRGVHLHLGVRYLRKLRSGGWTYPGITTQWAAVDYSNGTKGRIDPLPLFLPPGKMSTKAYQIASERQSAMYLRAGDALKAIGN